MILIATRKSQLALCQAKETQALLKKFYADVDLFPVVTSGDKLQKTALADVPGGGKGLFVKEIQEALLSQTAQIAVHSMKDLPIEQAAGLKLVSLLPRAGVRDVLVLSPQVMAQTGLGELSSHEKETLLQPTSFPKLRAKLLTSKIFCEEKIGTTSMRRQMLMRKCIQKNLKLDILRGNVDSRLKKVRQNEFAAIILAEAGLARLGLSGAQDMFSLPLNQFIPAAAQGAIGIEAAAVNADLIQNVGRIGCHQTALQVGMERLILFLLGGDCHAAIGAACEEDKLYVICAKNHMEKEAILSISPAEKKELAAMLAGCHFIYSDFFTQLCSSQFAENLKKQLLAADFKELMSA